jgi:hypothetical protein
MSHGRSASGFMRDRLCGATSAQDGGALRILMGDHGRIVISHTCFYCTVAFTTVFHFVPAVFTA